MTLGNTDHGLLRDLINLLNKIGSERIHDSNDVTAILKKRAYWKDKQAETPERTVNSYFSQIHMCLNDFAQIDIGSKQNI